ncbi:MAG: Hpt domain-containing protein, partial [Anaerotignaceae bacterium]
MNNGFDNSMLDMYLFETTSLLEQLEEIMLEAEKAKAFSTENINEIFRIMHTIKGSSAMMEFDVISKLTHRIEDLFFIFRDNNGVGDFGENLRTALFNLMFEANDFMKTEVSKIQNNEPLSNNIDTLIADINSFIEKITNHNINTEDTPAVSSATVSLDKESTGFLPETTAKHIIKIMFDEGCGMENLRSFMVVSSLKDVLEEDFAFYPDDVESNPDTMDFITANGFFIFLNSDILLEKAINHIDTLLNIGSLEVIENDVVEEKPKEEEKTNIQETIEDVQVAESKLPKSTPATSQASAQAKQSLISVNLSKLDSLMAIVGEIVITESMVTASPDLKGLKLDNFIKSARQLRKLTDEL